MKNALYLAISIIFMMTSCGGSKSENGKRDSVDSGPSLSTRGDSIAYFLAAYNAYYESNYFKRAIDLPADNIFNKILSTTGRDLIDKDRFKEIYDYYYKNGNVSTMPSMPQWFEEQIEILEYAAELNKEHDVFWKKRKHAEYNNAFIDLKEAFDKEGINPADINDYILLNIPNYQAKLDSISRLPDEAFKVYECRYGKWELQSDGFEAKISNTDSEAANITIRLLPGKIEISTPYFDDEEPAEASLFIESNESYDLLELKSRFKKDTYTITDSKSIHSFLNACVEPYNNNKLRVEFLYRGASHWGWIYFDLKDLNGAWSAYRAIN